MLKSLGLTALEKTINHLLCWDHHIAMKMEPLEHKIIRIELSEFKQHFYMIADPPQILLQSHCQRPADLSISGNLSAFVEMSSQPQHLPAAIHITGNAQLAQQFQQFFAAIDLDWEEQLSKLAGDVVTTEVASAIQQLRQSIKHGLKSFANNTTEYLQQESQLLPSQHMTEQYCQDVDQLRHRIARFELRLKRIEIQAKQTARGQSK